MFLKFLLSLKKLFSVSIYSERLYCLKPYGAVEKYKRVSQKFIVFGHEQPILYKQEKEPFTIICVYKDFDGYKVKNSPNKYASSCEDLIEL